ncbi:hypothetical protein BKA66DRAFT_85819 [Pyrenochaeta sp. MPI-SDFR-AT-0127]|nr:hypothetical protein BKA66DRAFT_85819 [Pyrenochaeta sp. MPI-SDFR-AT-0127]
MIKRWTRLAPLHIHPSASLSDSLPFCPLVLPHSSSSTAGFTHCTVTPVFIQDGGSRFPARAVSLPNSNYGNDTIEISPRSDLTITVKSAKLSTGQRCITHFKVEMKALATNSENFTASVRFNKANLYQKLQMEGADIGAMHVWFIYMHAAHEQENAEENEYADGNRAKRQRTDVLTESPKKSCSKLVLWLTQTSLVFGI